jgi:DNA-binding CsgD family transcriptional regulator
VPRTRFPVLTAAASDFVIEATVCRTIEALDARFLTFAAQLGFESAMFVNLSSIGAPIAPRVVFGRNDPWIAHYAAANYASIDPTISRAFRTRDAFTWRDVERTDAPRRQRKFFGEAREAWAKDGLIVPIHGPFGEFSVVNLLSDRDIALSEEEISILQSVCNIYASVGLTLMRGALPPSPLPALTRRERQCLYWMSVGKHDGDTAKILGLSAHTVRGHLDAVRGKLGVETRPELSLRALAYGLLVPDQGLMV